MKKLIILLVLLLSQSLWAAIGATAVWEVRTTGSNTNGGGYTSGGTDKSQQAAAGWALTGCTSAGAGNTVLNVNAAAAMVGNVGCCVSGTNFTTSEFFEVASVIVGTSITFGTSHAAASICTGIGANGVINIGGAFLIGGALDDDFFDAHTAGNLTYIQTSAGGVTYTLGEAVSAAVAGTGPLPITWEPYITARGTVPTGADRPIIACAANGLIFSSYNIVKDIIFTTTNANGIATGLNSCFIECKSTNIGGTTGAAFTVYNAASMISCEAVSVKGNAFSTNAAYSSYFNCYAHDCLDGFDVGTDDYPTHIVHCIAETCTTGIETGGQKDCIVANNTVRNCITGISGTNSYNSVFINNIITDCITGAAWTTEEKINYWDYNCWYNPAGADISNVTKGPHDVTANPLLVSGLASGTDGATDKLGTTFTAASAPFSGVTTSDCLLISVAGTGMTLGVYIISSVDSTSQLTLSTSAGASKTGATYGLIKGNDFTLSAGSPCFDAGLQPGSAIGL